MAHPKAAWGLEVGAFAIKALRLERNNDQVSVTDFAVVPHKKVLTTPDVDQDELTRLSLGQFISQNVLEGEHLVISVPGHAAFARFAKLPPVEAKKVPDIVKFEALQQIPFPIEQVQWDYETFTSEDTPEIEVGIFAITQDRVQQRLGLLGEMAIAPAMLTLSPVAAYNAMAFDHELSTRSGAVVYLDIGTSATDVIIAEEGRCWIRTFPLGGDHFTEAIAKAFKLSYSKAEKLKQQAASSKYAKQIMQAMRPVFSDLLQDLQRSIGYYQSVHRETNLSLMVGLGSTFKIPGLRKFLGQQLQLQVLRLDEFKKIAVTGREAAEFAQSTVNMATAYGLALQGVGMARIDANLMPVETLRSHLWHQKTKWFAAAAAVMVVGSLATLIPPIRDRGSMDHAGPPAIVSQVLDTGKRHKQRYETLERESKIGFTAENVRRFIDYRRVWPYLVHDAAEVLASTGPQPELTSGNAEKIKSIAPKQRRLVQLDTLSGDYWAPQQQGEKRQIQVTMMVSLSHDMPIEFLHETITPWLRENAEREGVPYRILSDSISTPRDEFVTIRVNADGEQPLGGPNQRGGGAAAGRRNRGNQGVGQRPPGPPRGGRKVPGPGGGGGVGGAGGGFKVGGGGVAKRQRTGERRRPPGPGPDGGIGGQDGTVPAGGGFAPRGGNGFGPRGGNPPAGAAIDLDTLAPTPKAPSLYPVGSTYYRVPVRFVIELLDTDTPIEPDETASAGGKESAS